MGGFVHDYVPLGAMNLLSPAPPEGTVNALLHVCTLTRFRRCSPRYHSLKRGFVDWLPNLWN
jgi:hypothetical protein